MAIRHSVRLSEVLQLLPLEALTPASADPLAATFRLADPQLPEGLPAQEDGIQPSGWSQKYLPGPPPLQAQAPVMQVIHRASGFIAESSATAIPYLIAHPVHSAQCGKIVGPNRCRGEIFPEVSGGTSSLSLHPRRARMRRALFSQASPRTNFFV